MTSINLTKQQMKQFKSADRVSFHYIKDRGESYIRLTKEEDEKHAFEENVHISCESEFVIYLEHNRLWKEDLKGLQAFNMLHVPKMSEEWLTFVSLLKENDQVKMRWVSMGGDGNSEGYLSEAKLYVDRLYLQIWRDDKKKYEMWITESITPNNSAKPIKYYL